MKKDTVFIETKLKQRLTGSPGFARKYAKALRRALMIPVWIMESGWRKGFCTTDADDLDAPRIGSCTFLFSGFEGNKEFLEAFKKTNRAKYVVSFQDGGSWGDGMVLVQGFFFQNKVIFRFTASYDAEGMGKIKILNSSPSKESVPRDTAIYEVGNLASIV